MYSRPSIEECLRYSNNKIGVFGRHATRAQTFISPRRGALEGTNRCGEHGGRKNEYRHNDCRKFYHVEESRPESENEDSVA